MVKFRERRMSAYDSTDALKNIKDSSILNKEKRGGLTNSKLAGIGAASGALLGYAGRPSSAGKLSKLAGGTKGALIGAGIGIGAGILRDSNKERKENNFYNRRLKEAQREAKRREKMDWNEKIHGRMSYE